MWSGEREAWSGCTANLASCVPKELSLHALRYTLHVAALVLTPEKPKLLIYEPQRQLPIEKFPQVRRHNVTNCKAGTCDFARRRKMP